MSSAPLVAGSSNGASSDPMSTVPPDMTLQVNLERSAYIQRIGKQLRDLLDIYDGFEAGAVQGTQLLESMRTIKRCDEIPRYLMRAFSYRRHSPTPRCHSIGNWTLLMKKTRLTRSTKLGWHPRQCQDGHDIAILSLVGPCLSATHVQAL